MELKVNAKWILSGEHAVIRGGYAVSFPASDYYLILKDTNSANHNIELEGIINHVKRYLDINYDIKCNFEIISNIPISCGFGSSAALSVAISKWFEANGLCNDALTLALHLENLFHKNSSGLDIYSVFYGKPIIYKKNEKIKILKTDWKPHFELAIVDSEKSTFECVSQVENFISKSEKIGNKVDENMNLASLNCIKAINNKDIDLLAKGINQACECFSIWGLITNQARLKMEEFYKNGAIAAKPIGSGCGGGILALYRK